MAQAITNKLDKLNQKRLARVFFLNSLLSWGDHEGLKSSQDVWFTKGQEPQEHAMDCGFFTDQRSLKMKLWGLLSGHSSEACVPNQQQGRLKRHLMDEEAT